MNQNMCPSEHTICEAEASAGSSVLVLYLLVYEYGSLIYECSTHTEMGTSEDGLQFLSSSIMRNRLLADSELYAVDLLAKVKVSSCVA